MILMSYNWQNGELITAEKLNQTGDAGFECTESRNTLTDETVTTVKPSGFPLDFGDGELSYTSLIDAESIIVTFDGTEYSCTRRGDIDLGYEYGAQNEPPSPDWTNYPFSILSVSGSNSIITQVAGTHTIKIETITSSAITTECFEKAVKKVLDMNTTPFKYVVNGSYDNNDDTVVVIDKTFDEIISAYNDGMDVELKLDIYIFRLSEIGNNVLAFTNVQILTGTGVRIQELRVTSRGAVSIRTGDITTPIN